MPIWPDLQQGAEMTIQTTPHLNFNGDARSALVFYQSVFGGHTTINSYADVGMPAELPGADKVVFGLVMAENGFRVMGYDVPGRTDGSMPAADRPDAKTTRRSPTRRCSSRSVRTPSTNCRATGTLWRPTPSSSSRSPRRHGAPDSACSPIGSASPRVSASSLPERRLRHE